MSRADRLLLVVVVLLAAAALGFTWLVPGFAFDTVPVYQGF